MTARHMVGTKTDGKTSSVTVDAEDALIAALKAKQTSPAAMITYVRKHNVPRGSASSAFRRFTSAPRRCGDNVRAGRGVPPDPT